MFKLKLPILINTEQTEEMYELGLEPDFNECEVGMKTFYGITAIGTCEQNGRKWTEIHANCDIFISPMSEMELEKKIDEQHKHNFTPN